MNKDNKNSVLALAVLGLLGLLIAITSPFKSFGDHIKLGLGDLMNGSISMIFLILATMVAIALRPKKNN